jgi:propanol-preferring alcohol dehydrogenase
MVLNRKTVRGSIVGTRLDLEEALAFAADGRVAVQYSLDRLENINAIFDKMKAGKITGRIVMEIGSSSDL